MVEMAKENTLPKELLDVLCCPACKSDLDYRKSEKRLVCKSRKCGRSYKIEDGIPIMLVE